MSNFKDFASGKIQTITDNEVTFDDGHTFAGSTFPLTVSYWRAKTVLPLEDDTKRVITLTANTTGNTFSYTSETPLVPLEEGDYYAFNVATQDNLNQLVRRADITLTSSQIRNIHRTPVEVVPAPSANEVHILENVMIRGTSGTTFTNANRIDDSTNDMAFGYYSGGDKYSFMSMTPSAVEWLFGQTNTGLILSRVNINSFPITNGTGSGIYVFAGDEAWTGGRPSLHVSVYYRTVQVPS